MCVELQRIITEMILRGDILYLILDIMQCTGNAKQFIKIFINLRKLIDIVTYICYNHNVVRRCYE